MIEANLRSSATVLIFGSCASAFAANVLRDFNTLGVVVVSPARMPRCRIELQAIDGWYAWVRGHPERRLCGRTIDLRENFSDVIVWWGRE